MQDYRERAFVIGTLTRIHIEYDFGKAFSIFRVRIIFGSIVFIFLSQGLITELVSNSYPKTLRAFPELR